MFNEIVDDSSQFHHEGIDLWAGTYIGNPGYEYYNRVDSLRWLDIKLCIPYDYYNHIHQRLYERNRLYSIILGLITKFYFFSKPLFRVLNEIIAFRFFKKNKFGAVYIHSGGYTRDESSTEVLKAARRAGIAKCVYVLHNFPPLQCNNKWDRKELIKTTQILEKYATDIIAVSEFTSSQTKEITDISVPITVIYNGLAETKMLHSLEEKMNVLGINSDCIIIGVISNICYRKGQIEALKAINYIVKNTKHTCKLVFIGNIVESDYAQECYDYVFENGLENVVSWHHIPSRAAEYMECFDIVLFPSVELESFGLVSLEAMMCKKPVVAYEVGGIPEVVLDGETGIIVPVEEGYKGLATAIVQLIDNSQCRDILGQNGRERWLHHFDDKSLRQGYIAHINK